MARQGIGTGSSPNDGTGDNLRVAGGKINDNFSELYTHFGDGTDLTAIVGTGIATASGLVGTGATILDFRGSAISEVTVGSGIATINVTGGSSGGSSYTDFDVNAHLNVSSAQANEVLRWTGTDYDWVAQASGGGGGGGSNLSDFSVTTNSVGTAALSYNNTSGVFTYTPPDLSSYLTSSTNSDLTFGGNLSVTGVSTFTTDKIFFKNGGASSPATLQIETGVAGVGNTIRSSNTLDLVTNGSAFKLELDTTNAIIASGTGASQYVQLYGAGSEKLRTTSTGITVTGSVDADSADIDGTLNLSATPTIRRGSLSWISGSANEIIHYAGDPGSTGGDTVFKSFLHSTSGNTEIFRIGYGEGGNGALSTPSGTLSVGGISTFSNDVTIRGSILSSYTGSTETYTVTTGSKTSAHRYNGTGSGSGYFIDGVEAPFLTLTPGKTYRFTNNNTGSHPLKFYLEADKTTEYTTGVTFDNAYTEIVVSDTTPQVLHYQCTNHAYMGNAVYTNANKVQTPYSASVGAGSSTNGIESPAITLSHNNPTVVGTSGTTGQFKQIGGQPYFYDGTDWRALFLIDGITTANEADTDWDNTMIRMNFEQSDIASTTNLKDGRTPATSLVDLVSSPVKYGSKSGRWDQGSMEFDQNNSGTVYYSFEGAWTMEGWFYFDSNNLPTATVAQSSAVFFSNQHPNTGVNSNWAFGLYKNSGAVYNFYWQNKNSSDATTGGTSGFLLQQMSSVDFADNAWHHIALTRKSSDGSIHFFFDGVESGSTSSNQLVDNEILDSTTKYFKIGQYGETGDYRNFYGNIDDIRVSKIERYTSNFTPPTSALPITGTTTTVVQPPDSKLGEIALGSSPAWTGTPGVTPSQIVSGQYRLTFSSAYSSATAYTVNVNAMDYDPAESIVGVGVSRVSGSVCDFFVRRLSDSSAVDTGSLAVNVYKK